MNPSTSPIAYGALMLAAGVGIPIMASLNANLGARLSSPVTATFILFFVGLCVTGSTLALVGLPSRLSLSTPHPVYFTGGLFVAFYVLSITWAVPHIGVGNAVFLVLLGQLLSAAAIDQLGAFGAAPSPMSHRRIMGVVFMAVGVVLARRLN